MRYILPEEGSKAKSLPESIKLPETRSGSFRVLGNMVNVELVFRVAFQLLKNKNKRTLSKTDLIENFE